jgi:hypothetical protein
LKVEFFLQLFFISFDLVKYNVSKEVIIKLNKKQTPDVMPSAIIGENWKTLTW